MMGVFGHRVWILILGLFGLAGCSYRQLANVDRLGTTATSVNAIEREEFLTSSVALGGFVISAYVKADAFMALPEDWSPGDYRRESGEFCHHIIPALGRHGHEGSITTWHEVENRVLPAVMDETLDLFAHLAEISSDKLDVFRENLPGVRYLILGRLDYNLLEDRAYAQASGMRGSIGRTIEVTMEVYDLEQGLSVWRNTFKNHSFGKVDPGLARHGGDLRLNRDSEGQLQPQVLGTTIAAPSLEEMVPDSLQYLTKMLCGNFFDEGEKAEGLESFYD